MAIYPCKYSKTGMCKHGGYKAYNYGFLCGVAGYCRYIKKWMSDMPCCPMPSSNQSKMTLWPSSTPKMIYR